jgi:hypothetical protein
LGVDLACYLCGRVDGTGLKVTGLAGRIESEGEGVVGAGQQWTARGHVDGWIVLWTSERGSTQQHQAGDNSGRQRRPIGLTCG